jgi:hypothetical protein
MNRIFHRVSLALLFFIVGSVFTGTAAADGKGWMIGGGAYYSDMNDWDDLDLENIEIEDITFGGSSFSYNVQVGYRFNKWLSLDASYTDLGDYEADVESNGFRQEFDVDAFTFGGMVSVPLWILDLYGRAGVADWKFDGPLVDRDGTDAYYGLGLAFNIGGSLDLYGEWLQYDFATRINNFGLGVRWTF